MFGRAYRSLTTSSQPNLRFVLEVDFLATAGAVPSGGVRLCCLLAWLDVALVFSMLKQFYRASLGHGQAQCFSLPLLLSDNLGKSLKYMSQKVMQASSTFKDDLDISGLL